MPLKCKDLEGTKSVCVCHEYHTAAMWRTGMKVCWSDAMRSTTLQDACQVCLTWIQSWGDHCGIYIGAHSVMTTTHTLEMSASKKVDTWENVLYKKRLRIDYNQRECINNNQTLGIPFFLNLYRTFLVNEKNWNMNYISDIIINITFIV